MIRSQQGFNLIELIVAIAIFGILATAVTVNLRQGGSSTQEVKLQANNLASLLREAQVKALAGEPFSGAVPTGGYGVHAEVCTSPPCSFTLFADVNSNFTYDGASEDVQTISMGTGVTVPAISTGGPLDVIFKPPRPFICFGNQCSGVGEATISLANPDGTGIRDVVVNQISGRISL